MTQVDSGVRRTREDLEHEKLERECEKLKAEIISLQRPWYQTTTSWVTILTVVVATGGVLIQAAHSGREYQLAAIKKAEVEYETQLLQADLTAYSRKVAKLASYRQGLRAENETLVAEQRELLAKNQALFERNAGLASVSSRQLQDENASMPEEVARRSTEVLLTKSDIGVTPRVYILINSESQRPVAEGVAEALQSHGILVPFIKVNRGSPDQTTLKYFDLGPEEKVGATQIVELLEKQKIKTRLSDPPMTPPQDRTAFRPRHYELWFGVVK